MRGVLVPLLSSLTSHAVQCRAAPRRAGEHIAFDLGGQRVTRVAFLQFPLAQKRMSVASGFHGRERGNPCPWPSGPCSPTHESGHDQHMTPARSRESRPASDIRFPADVICTKAAARTRPRYGRGGKARERGPRTRRPDAALRRGAVTAAAGRLASALMTRCFTARRDLTRTLPPRSRVRPAIRRAAGGGRRTRPPACAAGDSAWRGCC
jgi:hypothetical protein